MIIEVNVINQLDGMHRAVCTVDGQVTHEVVSGSKVGALAALEALVEADLDETRASYIAVRATMQTEMVKGGMSPTGGEVVFDAD